MRESLGYAYEGADASFVLLARRILGEVPQFFDVERYPAFTYAVTSATLDASGAVSILGTFTAHGQTHALPARGTLTSTDASTITVTVEADLDRSEWGMGWTKMGARLQNHLTAVAVFTRS